MTTRILVTAAKLHREGLSLLDGAGCETRFADTETEVATMVAEWRPHAIISRTLPLPGAVIAGAPTLRAIAKHGAGVNNIDVDAATKAGVPVFSTPGANSRAVAEFTMALIFAVTRQVARFDREVRSGRWERHSDGRQLAGMTLALVGYGRIARRVARIASAIDMRVIAFDPFGDVASARRAGVELVGGLEALLREADVLSLHCPAERGAPPLLDAQKLGLLPAGAYLVNTARGELVDEAALVSRLTAGHLAGAALDTFAIEPLAADSPLRELPNVVLAPHVAGSTPEALAAMASSAASTVLAYLDATNRRAPVPDEIWQRCVNADALRSHSEETRPGKLSG